MSKRKNTKQALITSALSLILCVSMLLGSTFAWFTDQVTSSGNIIKSGNLKIGMQWAETYNGGSTVWNDTEDTNAKTVFDYDKWEPGYTEVRYIKVTNQGNLAFKYLMSIIPTGNVGDLAEVIDVQYDIVTDNADFVAPTTLDKKGILTTVGTLDEVIDGTKAVVNGVLLPNGEKETGTYSGEVVVCIALHMQESAGNEYQNQSIGSAFDIQLLATQYTYESDSFGNLYDQLADASTYVSLTRTLAVGANSVDFTITKNNITIATISVPASAIDDITKPVSVTVDGIDPAETIAVSDDSKSYAYDINVTNLKDNLSEDQLITVILNAPTALPAISVYHNGELIEDAVYDEVNGTITFKTASFSPYAVTWNQKYAGNAEELRNCITGDNDVYITLTNDIVFDFNSDSEAFNGAEAHMAKSTAYNYAYYNGVNISGKNIAIDLNGHSITAEGNVGAVFFVMPESSLNITDTSATGEGMIMAKDPGYIVWAPYAEPSFCDIYGGIFVNDIYAGVTDSEKHNRAIVYAGEGGTINVYGGYFLYNNTPDDATNTNNGAFNVMDNYIADENPCITIYDGVKLINEHYRQSTGKDDTTVVLDAGCSIEEIILDTPLNINGTSYVTWYQVKKAEQLNLSYDDYVDITGKTVDIVDAGTPTSYQVGYSVEKNTILDTAVVTQRGNNLIATGIGTAMVRIDGEMYQIHVTAAPLSVFFLLGQSNMEGNEGDGDASIANENGQVYSTYGPSSEKMNLSDGKAFGSSNAAKFVPSALAGEYSSVASDGTEGYLNGESAVNALTESGSGKRGMDSAIAYQWNQLTGDKVWTVNASHSGSSIYTWEKTARQNYKDFKAMFNNVKETLESEVAAGHYTLKNYGYFWCQGCTDTDYTAEAYEAAYLNVHMILKDLCVIDHDANETTKDITLQFAGLIPVRAGHENDKKYREGNYTDDCEYSYFESYLDIQMTGPRVAQFHMGNDPSQTDIHLVWGDGSEWVTMPDGSCGVNGYFQKHYEGGKVDYPTQTTQTDDWRTPTTAADVHDTIHYNQIGYNEIGIRAAENLAYILNRAEAPQEETTVKFLSWDGYNVVDSLEASLKVNSSTLVVPVVNPIYESKSVTYSMTEGLDYSYYDLIVEDEEVIGTLTAEGASGSVKVTEFTVEDPVNYRWEFVDTDLSSVTTDGNTENELTSIAGTITDGVFGAGQYRAETAIELRHDRPWALEWKMTAVDVDGSKGIMLFSEVMEAKSVTGASYVYINMNSGLCAMGYWTGSKQYLYGVSLTDAEIDTTQEHIYKLTNIIADDGSNMVYLYVDDAEIGAMTNYYINATQNQNKKVKWVNGKDFSFGYMGVENSPIANCKIEYMQVWEGGIAE